MKKSFFYVGLLLGIVATGMFMAPKAVAAVKATLVEIVFPSQPFFAIATVPVNIPGPKAVGTNSGTLGVTNLTVTNFNSSPATIRIFQPVVASNSVDCSGVTGSGGPDSIQMTLRMDANSTVTLPFPSPLVFAPKDGHSCIAVDGPPGFFEVYVTSYVN